MGIFGTPRTGAGYIVLNIIRVMNIVSLLAVIGASVVMLVRVFNNNNSFFFFSAVEHVVRVTICGFLILTELPLFKSYWSRNWPLFSAQSGFVMLGVGMILVGNSTLANLNRTEASQEKLGLPFWRLVVGSSVVVIFFGAINIIASYIFRSKKLHLTARHVRSAGAVAPRKLELESSIAASTPKPNRRSRYKSFFLKKKHDSLPSYNSQVTRSNSNRNDVVDNNNTVTNNPMTQTNPYAHNNYTVTSPYGMSSPGKYETFGGPGHFPGSPSSKYSTDSPARPDIAHHPAHQPRGNYI